jgi:hypothetical protein
MIRRVRKFLHSRRRIYGQNRDTGARFIGLNNFDELGINNGDISPTEIQPHLKEIARVYWNY